MKKKTSESKSAAAKVDTSVLERVIELCLSNGLHEVEWELGEGKSRQRVVVRATGPAPMSAAPSFVSSAVPHAAPASAGAPKATSSGKQIVSPFVGTFYLSPSPGAPPYVKVGQSIKPGDVLCIVEAMKLMNEIEAEVSGKISAILVENGQPVEFGEPLFVVE